jgi:hypothetical protein
MYKSTQVDRIQNRLPVYCVYRIYRVYLSPPPLIPKLNPLGEWQFA